MVNSINNKDLVTKKEEFLELVLIQLKLNGKKRHIMLNIKINENDFDK